MAGRKPDPILGHYEDLLANMARIKRYTHRAADRADSRDFHGVIMALLEVAEAAGQAHQSILREYEFYKENGRSR